MSRDIEFAYDGDSGTFEIVLKMSDQRKCHPMLYFYSGEKEWGLLEGIGSSIHSPNYKLKRLSLGCLFR